MGLLRGILGIGGALTSQGKQPGFAGVGEAFLQPQVVLDRGAEMAENQKLAEATKDPAIQKMFGAVFQMQGLGEYQGAAQATMQLAQAYQQRGVDASKVLIPLLNSFKTANEGAGIGKTVAQTRAAQGRADLYGAQRESEEYLRGKQGELLGAKTAYEQGQDRRANELQGGKIGSLQALIDQRNASAGYSNAQADSERALLDDREAAEQALGYQRRMSGDYNAGQNRRADDLAPYEQQALSSLAGQRNAAGALSGSKILTDEALRDPRIDTERAKAEQYRSRSDLNNARSESEKMLRDPRLETEYARSRKLSADAGLTGAKQQTEELMLDPRIASERGKARKYETGATLDEARTDSELMEQAGTMPTKPGKQALPSAKEREQLSSLEALHNDLSFVNDLYQGGGKAYVGPGISRMSAIGEKTVGLAEKNTQMRRATRAIADNLLRAKSGAQINESEYERLVSLVPMTNDPPEVFETKLQDLNREVVSIYRTKVDNLRRYGMATPDGGPTPMSAVRGPSAGFSNISGGASSQQPTNGGGPSQLDRINQILRSRGVQ